MKLLALTLFALVACASASNYPYGEFVAESAEANEASGLYL